MANAIAALVVIAAALSAKRYANIWDGDPGSIGEVVVTLSLFAAQDGLVAWACLAIIILATFAGSRPIKGPSAIATLYTSRWAISVLIIASFAASLFVRVVLHHSYGLSLDEFMPEFQAEIFRSGHMLQFLSDADFAQTPWLQRHFTWASDPHQVWGSHYRPLHAALIALSVKLGSADLLNPLMAAITIWALADIARRVFPDTPEAPFLAAAMMLVSPQFLATNGSGFSFSSHLALNTLWLALFLRGGLLAHLGAALIGAIAIGLHQVHVHPLFAAPFLFALLLGQFGPRISTLPYIVIYAVAIPVWVLWPELAAYVETGDASVLPTSIWAVDYIRNYLEFSDTVAAPQSGLRGMLTSVNLLRFAVWLSPIVIAGAVLTFIYRREQPLVIWLCGASFLLTVLFCYVVMPNQMQSWGARYFHPVLGALNLLATAGYCSLRRMLGTGAFNWIVTGLVLSAAILLPWRGAQIDAKVGPRAELQMALTAIDADYVVIPAWDIWFGFDLVRNRADLTNRPRLLHSTPPQPLDGSVHILTPDDIYEMGLPHSTFLEPKMR